MTLVRVGQTIINFDVVAQVRDLSTTDALGVMVPGPLIIEFTAGDRVQINAGAAGLKAWIDGVTKNVTPS